MQIHVVRPGETLYGIARQYGVSVTLLGRLNQVPAGGALAVGQTLVVYEPERVHVVRPGETLEGIARREGVSVLSLYQNNYFLGGRSRILPDEELIVALKGEKSGTLGVNGYAYTFIRQEQLRTVLPYITYLTPFTYGITPQGGLVIPNDGPLLSAAPQYGAQPWMHLSTLADSGFFDSRLGGALLENETAQAALIDAVAANMAEKGYQGLDVDFEYVLPEQREAYAAFITRLREALNPLGCPVIVALAPKTSAAQRGLLYEAHDYALLGAAANAVFLMTYEWGYTYGPPMAVAPLGQVRTVLDYALTAVAPEKIFMGIPLYGYDWPLPFVSGKTRAESLSPVQAVEHALRHDIAIQYDAAAQAPYYHYTDRGGREHAVWFEDARSIEAKLRLADEYHLQGVGYWNLTRPFPQNWAVLASLFDIETLL
mgnify:CR=1 FL=1